MANYSLILDTKFKPFSYQEMLAPVAAATQAHQILEEEYGALADKASIWENMASEQSDPYAYKLFKTYANDLENQANQLMRYGLNPASRKAMLNMRSRYSKEILPIETAYNRRKELADKQRDAMAANPTLRYQRDMRNVSLDDLIKNPSLDWGESYSGALLTKQVSDAAANFQRVLTDVSKLSSIGLPFQYQQLRRRGASPAEVMMAISEDAKKGEPQAVAFLRNLRDQVLTASGVADWADAATMKEFTNFANLGLYSAIGQSDIQNFVDQAGLETHKANLADRNARRAEARAAAQITPPGGGQHYRLEPRALRSKEQLSAAGDQIARFEKYFEMGPRGHLVMTPEGRKEYFKKPSLDPGSGKGYSSEFRRFMDSLGAAKYQYESNQNTGFGVSGKRFIQPGNAGLLFQKYKKDNQEGSYDTYHSTEYYRGLSSDYGDYVLDQLKGTGDKLQPVTWKNRTWANDGDAIDTKSLNKGYSVSGISYNKNGVTAILTGPELKTIRIKIPKTIALGNQTNIAEAIKGADQMTAIINTGRVPQTVVGYDGQSRIKTDKNGNVVFSTAPLSPEDILNFEGKRDEMLDIMGLYGSQLFVPSKTETETYGVINQ